MPAFEEAASSVYRGRSIAFMGAGFSLGARNLAGKDIPTGRGLAALLAREIGEDETLPLDLVADIFLQDPANDGTLLDILKSRFMIAAVSEQHETIIAAPWRRIYTTNYDNAIERGCVQIGKPYSSATPQDDPAGFKTGATIVHLNGFIDRLNTRNIRQQVLLTSSQYAGDNLIRSPWPSILRADIDQADAVFSFGYSASDGDMQKLLFENPLNHKKTFFVVGLHADRETQIRALRFGAVIRNDISAIADFFSVPASGIDPRELRYPVNFREIDWSPISPVQPTSTDTISLLTKGDWSDAFMISDFAMGEVNYCIRRTVIDDILKPLRGGHHPVLIHSDIGNGKTILVHQVAYFLRQAGYRVFALAIETDDFRDDVAYLENIEGDIVLLIEDVYSNVRTIEQLMLLLSSAKMIFTIRTATYEVRLEDIEARFGADAVIVDINVLSEEELKTVANLFNKYGLWGGRAGASARAKLRFSRKDCRGQLRTILLSMLQSRHIRERLRKSIAEIRAQGHDMERAFVATLALAYVGHTFSIGALCAVLDHDLFKASRTQSSEMVREFFDFQADRVRVRSPIFAEYLLNDMISDQVLINELPDLIARLVRMSSATRMFRAPAMKLMRFNTIEPLLRPEHRNKKLVDFYEGIRKTGIGESNPQFWLQYAIARMSFADYDNAERYFKHSYGLARGRRGYDTYQIDNHFARFLVESRSRTELWNDYIEAFEEAHKILISQMDDHSQGYYPYRVARLYLEFIETRHGDLEPDELQLFRDSCDAVLARIKKAPPSLRRHKYVKDCESMIQGAVDFCDS